MVTMIPAHCNIENCSLKISNAPIRVHMGLDALIGVTMVMGRFLSAKYAKIHDVPTMAAFNIKCRCAV